MLPEAPTPETLRARLITFNVRYATQSPEQGEEPWKVRCSRLCALVKSLTSDHPSVFICFQEALASQLRDISFVLGPSFAWIGRGRDDGDEAGEFSPIFYRHEQWTCDRDNTYWLSETPKEPSKSWDATLPRIVTVGLFTNLHTKSRIVIMSAHLDHAGKEARERSAEILSRLAWAISEDTTPVFIAGDFNSTPDEEPYKLMTKPKSSTRMVDSSGLAPENRENGTVNNEVTYTSFGQPGEDRKRIDYVFAKQTPGLKIDGYQVVSNLSEDGILVSDHKPVVVDMEMPVA